MGVRNDASLEKSSLKIIWYIRDAPSGNTPLLASCRNTLAYLGMTGATLHSLSSSTAIQKQLFCFAKFHIIITSARRKQSGIASHTWIASMESWASFPMLSQVSVAPTQAQGELLKWFLLKKEYFSVWLTEKKKKKKDSSLFIADRKGLKKPLTLLPGVRGLCYSPNKPSPGNSRERGVFYLLIQRWALPVSGWDLEGSEDAEDGEKPTYLFLRNMAVFKETL